MKRLFIILLILCPYVSYGHLHAQMYSTSSSTFRSFSTTGVGAAAPNTIEFRSTNTYGKNLSNTTERTFSTAPMHVANGTIKTIASSLSGVPVEDSNVGYIPPTRPQRAPGVPDTPIGDGWDVALLLALLCVGYMVWKYMSVKRLKG